VVALSIVGVLECPECVVARLATDPFPSRLLCFFVDTSRAPGIVVPDDSGATNAEYGGGFSRERPPEGDVARSERASTALPVGLGALGRFLWRVGDMARKGVIMSAASVTGNDALFPSEEKPADTGETSGDVAARLVVEWAGDARGETDLYVYPYGKGCAPAW